MKISSAFPSDYLRAADLGGRPITVTMARVAMADIGGDPKPILYFQGKDKGMVLNKTNANKIAEIYGDDTDSWSGGEIVLYETMVDFQGKTVPAIRVRMQPRKVNNRNVIRNEPVERETNPPNQPDIDAPFDDSVTF